MLFDLKISFSKNNSKKFVLGLSYIKQGLDESKEVTKDYAPKILLLLTKAKMLMRLDKFPESRRAIDLAESQPSSGAQSLLEPVWQFRIGPLQRRLDLTWANIYQSHEVVENINFKFERICIISYSNIFEHN